MTATSIERRRPSCRPGTDHLGGGADEEVIPDGLTNLFDRGEQRPFLLFVGNSYFHKNRLFAFRVADELRCNHGWDGAVVSAGGTPGKRARPSVRSAPSCATGHTPAMRISTSIA